MSETSDLLTETVSSLPQVEEFLPRRFLRKWPTRRYLWATLPPGDMSCLKRRRTLFKSTQARALPGKQWFQFGRGGAVIQGGPMFVTAAPAMCFAIAIGRRTPASALP